ncbi:hypothetical protein ACFWP7_26465 [Streptomyces sp. NPDC058470]|uniref:hypothetical protein n=1 Tax=Streptomyces sp. NPDC058470 TaxID=3346515 RepID=UPI00365A9307
MRSSTHDIMDSASKAGSGRRVTALGLAVLFAAAAMATTGCGGNSDTAARPTAARSAPPETTELGAVEGKAYGYHPYVWATRAPSTIGVHGLVLRDQSFTVGGQVKMALFKDGGVPGVPSWYKTTTARSVSGRPGGGFDFTTGLLDCTAYGYAKNSTLMALDVTTNTWSSKARVSTGCGN